jgi:lipid II:glycine glycyltransferase (peptidoglycan interpeptide bridge formation enzyme)
LAVPLKYKAGVISYAYQPIFVQQAGIFSQMPLTAESVSAFLSLLRSRLGKIKLYLTPECTPLVKEPETELRVSQYIRLQGKTIHEIKAGYSENVRRNIRRAEKKGLSLQFSLDFEAVIRGFRNQAGEHVKQIGDFGFRLLQELLYNLQRHTDSYVAQVFTREGELLYSAFFAGYGGKALYVKGAGTDLARHTGAGHFLMDRMIRKFHEDGYGIFDFGGANAENVRKFNLQFGSDEFEYLCVSGGYLPGILL